MDKKTIEKIKALLTREVETTRARMLREIEWGSDVAAEKLVAEYRDIFLTLDNFGDWLNEENENE